MQEPFSIYIHFPYCKSRCPYCDFFRALKPKEFDENALVARYVADLDYILPYIEGRAVKSVFFGGGTPSLLSARAVEVVLGEIGKRFKLLPEAEISLEANPNTFEQEKFCAFLGAGINRLSLGVQALDDKSLRFLGRTHSLNDALRAMELGAKVFPKFSVDLIYARQEQNWDNWQKELDLALSFGMKHISLYQLTIEEGTVFERKNIATLDEENSVSLYEQTISYLRERGFERYEVSNFATEVAEQSVHNLVYWQGGDYIGLGDGAHGRFNGKGKIYASVDGKITETLTAYERAEELLFMGLRLKEGINADRFYEVSGVRLVDFINQKAVDDFVKQGLVQYDNLGMRLSDDGFLLLNKIVLDLVS